MIGFLFQIGAEANQAIMLVTDGVPYTYETIFQEYNQPHKPVRVFTYLIGREISDLDAARWMACENKGYFTHVTTLAEVKEQVLKYIPVMARPLVLLRETHPVRWTGVYADIEVSHGDNQWLAKQEGGVNQSVICKYHILMIKGSQRKKPLGYWSGKANDQKETPSKRLTTY